MLNPQENRVEVFAQKLNAQVLIPHSSLSFADETAEKESIMDAVKWNYYQFRKSYDYPIYVRFKQDEANAKLTHILSEMGFSALTDQESRKIKLGRPNTRILTMQPTGSRLQQQITGSDILDKYGAESLSLQGGMPIYTYRKVGALGLPYGKTLWDLSLLPDISHTDQMVGIRIILVRFLAQALSYAGILCYWGTVKDDTVIVMKQGQSFGEAVIIDVQKRVVFSNGGEMKLGSSLKIIRKDKEVKTPLVMSREDLIGFLSVSTCLLSFNGISSAMRKSIYDLSAHTSGSYAVTESAVNL